MDNNEDIKCALQDELVTNLIDAIENYVDSDKVSASGMDEDSKSDIVIASLLTIFANHLAYVAAQEEAVDFNPHIEDSFKAVKTLFARLRTQFLQEMGKEDPLQQSSKSKTSKPTKSNKKKDQTVH